jgi:hypothetical protein
MNKETNFPKKAAYFCLAAPFISSVFASSAKGAPENNMVVGGLSMLMLGLGIGFGVYALIRSKRTKGIIIPAAIGLVFHTLIVFIAYGSFKEYRSREVFLKFSIR